MQERRFTIPSDAGQFNRVYGAISEVVEALGLIGAEKFRFAICVSEAFTNAFYHGNRSDPDKSVGLNFCWDDQELRVEVEDEGRGRIVDIDLKQELQGIAAEKSDGRGVAIIRRYADKVEVEEKVGGGLRVKLYWDLSPLRQRVPLVT